MSPLVLVIVIMGAFIMLLIGIMAFLVSLLHVAYEEKEAWDKPVEPPDVDWERWDYIRGQGWKEDKKNAAQKAADQCRV
jgi:hypothetical protein